MSARDFMPYISGTEPLKTAYPIAAGSTILMGEPVVLDANGVLQVAGNNPSAVLGIAAQSAASLLNTAAGTPLTVYRVSDDILFKTRLFATDGLGTDATPDQTVLGDQAGLVRVAPAVDWHLDTGAGNLICEIEDILDAHGNSIISPAAGGILPGPASEVIFRFLAR